MKYQWDIVPQDNRSLQSNHKYCVLTITEYPKPQSKQFTHSDLFNLQNKPRTYESDPFTNEETEA